MNQPPTVPDAPFGADTDEAISALVDGELGAFAAERGLTEGAARDRLESWPGLIARRAALEEGRAAVGASTPPLDDLTRRRLVRAATNELPGSATAPSAPQRPWAKIAAIAAAGLVVVAGLGIAISATGGDDSSMSSSTGGSASTADEPLRGDVGDLGDVTSPDALRALLDRREDAAGAATDDSAEQPERTTADSAPESQSGTGSIDSGADTEAGSPTAEPLSPETCARRLAGSRKVAFTGTGTYQGTPVTIIGITERGRTIVFVVPSTDCTDVLASISR